jgi:hypothetical protein
MSLEEILTHAWEIVSPAGQTIAGFVSAWAIFVLQAKRKEKAAAQAARESLIEELKWLEVQLAFAVIKCAYHSDIVDRGVKEFRWAFKEGFARVKLGDFKPEEIQIMQNEATHSDEQIAAIFNSGLIRHESQALELPTTVIDAVAGAPTSAKLSSIEIKRLLDVKWQVQMLNAEARNMTDSLRLTFTVTDEQNHQIVKLNHSASLRSYGRRAAHALDFARSALSELGQGR